MATIDAPASTAQKRRRPGAIVVVLLLVGLAIVLAGVFPFRQLIAQQRLVDNTEAKLGALIAENEALQAEIDAVASPAQLERIALEDPYFAEKKLFPNVDFYSGILLRAIGIPLNMYPVMFAIGRMPGWIANWHELHAHKQRISRPRQIYTGSNTRSYKPIEER